VRAAFQDRYGPPEVVQVRDVATPAAGENQVLVRVHAASVNRADLDALGPRPGFIRPIIGMRAPRNKRVGIDVAGVVESVGPGVAAFKPGDRVFGDMFSFGQGTFAEYVCAPAKAIARIPE
jgi:NADPH:quinone reductase-like Zn-dependent oxidoreductase